MCPSPLLPIYNVIQFKCCNFYFTRFFSFVNLCLLLYYFSHLYLHNYVSARNWRNKFMLFHFYFILPWPWSPEQPPVTNKRIPLLSSFEAAIYFSRWQFPQGAFYFNLHSSISKGQGSICSFNLNLVLYTNKKTNKWKTEPMSIMILVVALRLHNSRSNLNRSRNVASKRDRKTGEKRLGARERTRTSRKSRRALTLGKGRGHGI